MEESMALFLITNKKKRAYANYQASQKEKKKNPKMLQGHFLL